MHISIEWMDEWNWRMKNFNWIQVHGHTHTHECNTNTHTQPHMHECMNAYAFVHACIYTCLRTYTHTQINVCVFMQTHAAYADAPTATHTCIYLSFSIVWFDLTWPRYDPLLWLNICCLILFETFPSHQINEPHTCSSTMLLQEARRDKRGHHSQ